MRLLVCGGRHYADRETVFSVLDCYFDRVSIVIQGGASGADNLAKRWAVDRGVHYAEVPAKWETLGRGAGFARNNAMMALKPDFFVAFPGGSGTAGMVRLCRAAGVPGVEL